MTAARSTPMKANDMDLILKVDGMTCQHCVANVRKALEDVDQVQQAVVDLASGLVTVTGDKLDKGALAEAVAKAGYKVVGS